MFVSQNINITNENNMSLMARYPDNYFDLAIVDPPYGINAPNQPMGSSPNKTNNIKYPAISTADRLRKGRLNSGSGHMKNSVLVNSDLSWDIVPDQSYFDELFRVSKNQIIWGGIILTYRQQEV
ncbi:MAG: phage modification methylase [Sphingobacterium multivorum]|jgi:site-specific DNA-methyltransferase (adenine-specific)|nr:phage modification methylase [Sphingobacterium multivorum]